MWLINTLLFSKIDLLFLELRNTKMAACGVKVGKIILLWNRWTCHIHNIWIHCYIYNICEKVFHCINYWENTEKMALFQMYEVFY